MAMFRDFATARGLPLPPLWPVPAVGFYFCSAPSVRARSAECSFQCVREGVPP